MLPKVCPCLGTPIDFDAYWQDCMKHHSGGSFHNIMGLRPEYHNPGRTVHSSAQVIGAPLAAGILYMDGLGGLRGWQWLFILEGSLTAIYGVLLKVRCAAAVKTLNQNPKPLKSCCCNSMLACPG